jgi:serine palmitoyltransferase
MADLERVLSNINKEDKRLKRDPTQQRRFIVVEGLYRNTGNICPLPELLRLKEKYFYRIIVDEAMSMGTCGATGKGITEHFGIPITEIEILTFTLDTTFASVGGVCVGSRDVVDHQRLSGAGYCFSASTPPFLVAGGIAALEILRSRPELIKNLKTNCKFVHDELSSIRGWRLLSETPSPVIHLALDPAPEDKSKEFEAVKAVVDECMNKGIGIVANNFSIVNSHAKSISMPVSIRVAVTAALSPSELKKAVAEISKAARAVADRL